MNMRLFGVLLAIVGLILLAYGGYLWSTGKASDGKVVGSGSVMNILAETSALEARRGASRGPLVLGAIASVLGGIIAVSAHSRKAA